MWQHYHICTKFQEKRLIFGSCIILVNFVPVTHSKPALGSGNLSAKNDPQKYFLAKKTPKKQLTKHGSSSGCALDVHWCHNDSPCDHHGMPTVRLIVLFSSRNTLFVHPPSTHSYLISFFLLSCPPMLSYLPFLSSSFLLHTATASHKYQKQRSAEGGIAINARSSAETNFSESLAPNKFELMN